MAVYLEAFKPDKEQLKVHTGPWGAALDRGVGLVIGYGPGLYAGRFRYQVQKADPPVEGLDEEEAEELRARWKSDPINGGGYHITSKQARMMAVALWGLISVERGKAEEWAQLPPQWREALGKTRSSLEIYGPPKPEHLVEVWEELAVWMAESGGFRIW